MYFFLLEAAQPATQAESGGLTQTLMMFGVGLLLFYFMLFRPEQKRRKAEETKRSSLKKGDRATTVSGIIGTIAKVDDKTVILSMVDGTKIEVLKAAIGEVEQSVSSDKAS